MPVVNPGIRRLLASAIQRLFNGASFSAPLTHSAIPTRAASGTTATFTRATTATVRDNEGVLRTAIAGEARFEGARRVYNQWSVASEPTSSTGYHTATNVTFDSGISGFAGSAYFADASVNRTLRPLANSAALNRTWLVSFYVQRDDGGVPDLNGYDDLTLTLDGSDILSGVTVTLVSGTLYRAVKKWTPTSSQEVIVRKYTGGFNNNNPIRATGFQLEDITGRADQTTPSEYVSVGVESATYYHGSFVDGVKCFATDINGAAIPSITLLGYSAEGARTNLCLQSQTFDSWTDSGASVTANTTVAPDGTTTADTIVRVSGQGDARFVTPTLVSNAVHAVSLWIKKGTSPSSLIALYDVTAVTYRLFADVTWSGTTPVFAFTSGSLIRSTEWANGLWRIELLTEAVVAANTNRLYIYPGRAGSANGETVIAWGAQVELGSFASSYIPTTTIAVARNADVLTYSSAGNLGATAGWVYAEFGEQSPGGGAAVREIVAIATDANNTIRIEDNSAGSVRLVNVTGGSTDVNSTLGAITAGWVMNKVAASYATNNYKGTLNTNAVVSDTSATVPAFTTIYVGDLAGSGGALFGTIRNVRIGQRALSSSELQAVTA